jgi:starch phosphorylase
MDLVSDEAPPRIVHLLSSDPASERAQEMAPALAAAGYDVRRAVAPAAAAASGGPAAGDAEQLRAELSVLTSAVRDALETGGQLLLADERSALAVPELMRLLLDERGQGWDEAWARVRSATSCRLGSPKSEPGRPFWTAGFLEAERPRLLEILYEINRRQLEEAEAQWPGDLERRRRLSLFREGDPKRLRPGLLAVLASHRADVATPWDGPIGEALADLSVLRGRALHARPTPVFGRAWLVDGNPELAGLLAEALGPGWSAERESLGRLEGLAFDAAFRDGFRAARRRSRERLAALVQERAGVRLDPDWLVDLRPWTGLPQERPLLNVLGLVREHLRVAAGGWTPPCGRTVVLAGAVAPRLRQLVQAVVDAVAADPRARACLRAVFLPDCDEAALRRLVAAADLSNQPGAAGSGAAGARALALALSGAVTLGTRDGTVRELEEAVGGENLFLFGLGPLETRAWREGHVYRPEDVYALDPLVRIALDAVVSKRYARAAGDFDWVRRELLDERDPWLVIADFGGYVHRQDDALAEFADPRTFSEKAIVTLSRARRFWVDRLDPGA